MTTHFKFTKRIIFFDISKVDMNDFGLIYSVDTYCKLVSNCDTALITWLSKRQLNVILSIYKVKHVVATPCNSMKLAKEFVGRVKSTPKWPNNDFCQRQVKNLSFMIKANITTLDSTTYESALQARCVIEVFEV